MSIHYSPVQKIFGSLRAYPSNTKPGLAKNRLIIGRKPLLEALAEGKEIDKIFLLQTATGEEINQIKSAASKFNIPVSKVPVEKLNRFTKVNHQGVVAIAGLISFQPLQEIISQVVEKGEVPLIIVSDGITDTRNLGALARSAYCYGAHALVLPASNNAAVTEEAIKASAGALEHLPVCRVKSIEEAYDILHLNGIATLATGLSATESLDNADLTLPLAWVLGSEDKGVSNFVIKKSTSLVKIPMSDNFDSLNVAVAGGILFYETFRQRAVGSQ